MKVDFYTANDQNAPTVENYLFTKELSQVMNGEFIENEGQYYQVIGQTLPDLPEPVNPDVFTPLPSPLVFVFPVPNRPIQINLKDTRHE